MTGRRVNANTVNNRTVVTTQATFPRHNFNGNPVGLLVHFTNTPHGALLTQQATLMVMLPDSNSYRNIRQPHILMEPMTTRTSKKKKQQKIKPREVNTYYENGRKKRKTTRYEYESS